MTDVEIIELFWVRSETAISETARIYGAYCKTIAMNILRNTEDAEECVNDTYMKTWETIPPQRPVVLYTFLGRITRNLSLDRYKARKAQKRTGDETALLLSELDDCVSARKSVEDEFEAGLVAEAIDRFLASVSEEYQIIFIRRYWYANSIAAIAERFEMSESKVKSILFRMRKNLRIFLEREGVEV